MSDHRMSEDEAAEGAYEPRTEGYRTLKLNGLVEQVLRTLLALLQQLENLWPMMPKVGENGYSECPFAEDLYRRKAALESQVSEKVAILNDTRDEVSREIERCKRNLARISVDAAKLDHQPAKRKYGEGFCLQEQEYREAKWQLSEVDRALLRAQATLDASRRKAYPIPLKDESESKGLPASASSFPEGKGRSQLDREVSDLLSLGRK